MGANVDTVIIADVPRKKIKKLFENAAEEARYENGHGGYTGTIAEISTIGKFVDQELSGVLLAEEYITENHDKWSQAMAVSYLTKDGLKRWLVGGWCSE
jgi:ABC-type Fe3+-citrate transport system substrate-binding protein